MILNFGQICNSLKINVDVCNSSLYVHYFMISLRFNFIVFRFNILTPSVSTFIFFSFSGWVFHLLQVEYFIFSRFNIPSPPSSMFHHPQVQKSKFSRFNIPYSPSSIILALQVQYSTFSRFSILCSPYSIFHLLQVQSSIFSRFNIPSSPGSIFPVFQLYRNHHFTRI